MNATTMGIRHACSPGSTFNTMCAGCATRDEVRGTPGRSWSREQCALGGTVAVQKVSGTVHEHGRHPLPTLMRSPSVSVSRWYGRSYLPFQLDCRPAVAHRRQLPACSRQGRKQHVSCIHHCCSVAGLCSVMGLLRLWSALRPITRAPGSSGHPSGQQACVPLTWLLGLSKDMP